MQPMPDTPNRLFEVSCKSCLRTPITVARLCDPDIALVTDHLRACSAYEPLGEEPMLGAIMARVQVTRVARG